MENLLNKHLDKMDVLELEIRDIIDKIIGDININEILMNPEKGIARAADTLRIILKEKYIPEAITEGINVAEAIKEKIGKIKISDSDDPILNKDES